MRIIAGKYRGRKLQSPPSLETRPTSDRLRETLFNILAPRIKGVRFLDLCAGSGAVGIEALSRGARQATFVDQSQAMCRLISENLGTVKVEPDEAEVLNQESAAFLRSATRRGETFDLMFFDPPYAMDYEPVLTFIGEPANQLLASEGVLVVEHHHKKDLKAEYGELKRYRELKQGDSSLSFYQMAL